MNLRSKIMLMAMIPLILAIATISLVIAYKAKQLSDQEIKSFEQKLLRDKKDEIKMFVDLALSAINNTYKNSSIAKEEAQERVKKILSNLEFGADGYFYVYDFRGNSLVHPIQKYRVGKNWWKLADPEGNLVIQHLIKQAKKGGGYHQYLWEKPSTKTDTNPKGKIAEKLGYAVALKDWNWMLGTGIYIDDIRKKIAQSKIEVERRIRQTFVIVAAITLIALFIVFVTGIAINFHERRLADSKLKALTQRIIDTQEEERTRVARELHDGISQILVSVKYTLELAEQKLKATNGAFKEHTGNTTQKALGTLDLAIKEVRRISRDLRPSMLDDLGLSPALKNLTEQFTERTGIEMDVKTVVFRNLLPKDAKTALYRVAQEALTNIERHSQASKVDLHLSVSKAGIKLLIRDNGKGFMPGMIAKSKVPNMGIGLRNMQERIEHFDGELHVNSSEKGTEIIAILPQNIMTSHKDFRQGVIIHESA